MGVEFSSIGTGGAYHFADLYLLAPAGTAFLVINHDTGYNKIDAAWVPDNDWHLMEVAVTGIGTATGETRWYVDGALSVQRTGLKWTNTNFKVTNWLLGAIYSKNDTFTGTIDFDDALWIIEMQLVTPPYLLDFGKAYVDVRPDYSQDALDCWEEQYQELWGEERWKEVRRALATLTIVGIYYQDPTPRNIHFGEPEDDDE